MTLISEFRRIKFDHLSSWRRKRRRARLTALPALFGCSQGERQTPKLLAVANHCRSVTRASKKERSRRAGQTKLRQVVAEQKSHFVEVILQMLKIQVRTEKYVFLTNNCVLRFDKCIDLLWCLNRSLQWRKLYSKPSINAFISML